MNRALTLYRNSFAGLSREIWLLSAVTLINRTGTMVIPFLTIYLTTVLDFSYGQAGIVMACFGAGSVLGSYLGGRLTDRFGYYRVMFWSLLLGGGMFLLLGQIRSFIGICLFIFLQGIIADAFRPAIMVAIGAFSTSETRTRALSLIRLAINLGFAAGPAIGGLIAASRGYDLLFWVDGLTCMGAAFFFMFVFNEKKTGKEVQKAEVAEQSAGISAMKDKSYLWFLLFTLFSAVVFMQLFSTLPVFLKDDLLLNEDQIGFLMAMNGFLIALIEMPLVYTFEKRHNLTHVIVIGVFMIGLSFLVLNIPGLGMAIAAVSMLIITFGEMLAIPFTNSFAMTMADRGNMGQYMGLYSMNFSIAFILAPLIGMKVAGVWGFNVWWSLCMVLSLIAVGGYLYLEKQKKTQLDV